MIRSECPRNYVNTRMKIANCTDTTVTDLPTLAAFREHPVHQRCTPFYALAPTAAEFPLQVYPCALHEKRKRQHPVEEGEPYSCIEHSRHIGRYPVDTKVTNQWRRGGRSRRILFIYNEMQIPIIFRIRNDDNV